ncbi:MAG: hypothetical protein BMS9Abin24_047 [Thermodesulfobacteriota bacterium]|nr:MAG: hypothetical protein BMS9Abin24_047 [Thermodesulfobacteriota bacterium]
MSADYIPYRRRKFFINKGLQGRFVIGFSSAVFVGLLVNLVLVYFLIDRELAGELYKIHLKIRTTSEIAVPVLLKLGAVTIPSIIIISAVIGYLLTSGIEGSLKEFRRAVRETGRGDLTQRFSGSASTELSGPFNSALKSLAQRFGALKRSGHALDEGLGRLNSALGRDPVSRAEIEDALGGVRGARESIGRELSGFKL